MGKRRVGCSVDGAYFSAGLLEQGTPGEIYNVTAGQEQTNRQMAQWILDILKRPRDLIRQVKDRPGHDRRYALDAAKIESKLAWRPKVALEDGIRSTIEWYRQHRTWWERIKTGEYRHYYAKWYGGRLKATAE